MATIEITWVVGLVFISAVAGFVFGRKARNAKITHPSEQATKLSTKGLPRASIAANLDYASTILAIPRSQEQASGQVLVSAASRRGTAHSEKGTPRQDNLCVLTNDDELVIVISDGTSSAKESHLGSLFLVQNFERYYREHFPAGFTADVSVWRELNLKLSQGLVAMYVARSKQKGISTPSDVVDLRLAAAEQYASTLEVFIVKIGAKSDDLPFAYIRIAGDGAAFEISTSVRELPYGQSGDGNMKDSSVSALPVCDSDPEIFEGSIAPGNALMVATDGIGDYIAYNSTWSKCLLDYAMSEVPSEAGALAVISHLDSNSRDDRTFAIVRNHKS